MRIKNFVIGLAAMCVMLIPVLGHGADWAPRGSLTLQIGFGAGGSTDILGRLIAANVEENTGWNVVVENKPGGGGVAMLSGLMNKKPDGNTVGLCVNVPIILNLIKRGDKLPFKIESFDYIGTAMRGEVALVAKSNAPFDDINSFLSFAKSKKAAVAFDAMPQQMIMTAVANQAKVQFKFVKHKSGAEQIQSVLGGHVDVGCPAGAHIKYLKSGDLKMLVVFNKQRHGYSPDTKTLIENGYNYYLDPYYYLVAPKGLPENVHSALAKAFNDAIYSEKVKKVLANTFKTEPHNLGSEATQKMLSDGVSDMKRVIQAGN
jgi:tripartite-type tricarboxylate transporter receptor subunit TctC